MKQFKNVNVVNSNKDSNYEWLFDKYQDLFNDKIGKLKGYQVKLHIDETIVPRKQAYRRVPYHLLKALDGELDKLIENDVIEPVVTPPKWISPIVAVPKPKKPGEVRITVDSRVANKAIIRIKYVSPTTTEIAYDLNGMSLVSLVDMNKAFHQLELEEGSREITSFITHRGLFRFKIMHMGVCSATEEFQHVVQHVVLRGLEGTRNLVDDIIVYGKDKDEHDRRLVAMCDRLRECGMTVSRTSCKLGVKELVFFGLKISKHGVAPSEDKVRALREAKIPENGDTLTAFLGLAVYLSPHIPNLSTLADPLYELARAEVFDWEQRHTLSFNAIKQALITKALVFFNVDWLTELTVDASPVGLGAVLAQINPIDDGQRVLITCKSRVLSSTERR